MWVVEGLESFDTYDCFDKNKSLIGMKTGITILFQNKDTQMTSLQNIKSPVMPKHNNCNLLK